MNASAPSLSSDPSPAHAYEIVSAVIRARRTSLAVNTSRVVPISVVEELCQLAQCAPNHKRTAPWRFALAAGTRRNDLGEIVARTLLAAGHTEERVARTATKYLRAPTVVIVGSASGDSELRSAENRDAVAAGIQNMLLAATALGLSSHWSSCPLEAHDDVAEFCGFESGTSILAAIYFGWPATAAMGERRMGRQNAEALRIL